MLVVSQNSSQLIHTKSSPIRVLKMQRQIVAPDYPFFTVRVFECSCGCKGCYVTLDKTDLGYVKTIFDLEYNTPLEAFVKFEKTVTECLEGKYDSCATRHGEGEPFM